MSRSAHELLAWAAVYIANAAEDLEASYAVGGIGGTFDPEDEIVQAEIAECRQFVIDAREIIGQ